jgi:uncharacterized heparinase superfamily protein
VRFHLHPAVKATLAQSGQAVLMRLPSGRGWRCAPRAPASAWPRASISARTAACAAPSRSCWSARCRSRAAP